jgi:hypothetical protein
MNSSALVQKLRNYCNVLRDDGRSYGDYVEQLTYLMFVKMADERSPGAMVDSFTPELLKGEPGIDASLKRAQGLRASILATVVGRSENVA